MATLEGKPARQETTLEKYGLMHQPMALHTVWEWIAGEFQAPAGGPRRLNDMRTRGRKLEYVL